MLLDDDKKKIATIIISGLGKKDEALTGHPDDISYGLESAMEKFLEAIEKKDAKMMSSYLKDAVEMCINECESTEAKKVEEMY